MLMSVAAAPSMNLVGLIKQQCSGGLISGQVIMAQACVIEQMDFVSTQMVLTNVHATLDSSLDNQTLFAILSMSAKMAEMNSVEIAQNATNILALNVCVQMDGLEISAIKILT